MLLTIDPQITSALRGRTKFPERCAILLQQIKFWLSTPASGVVLDDGKWVWNSVKRWQQQLPWLSPAQIRRTLEELEDMGLVKCRHFTGTRATNRSKLYALCTDRLEALLSSICSPIANGFDAPAQMDLRSSDKSNRDHNQYPQTENPCVCSAAKIEENAVEAGEENAEALQAIQQAIANLGADPEDESLKRICEGKFSALGQKAAEVVGDAVKAVQQIQHLREPAIAALKCAIAGEWKPQRDRPAAAAAKRESAPDQRAAFEHECLGADGKPFPYFVNWRAEAYKYQPSLIGTPYAAAAAEISRKIRLAAAGDTLPLDALWADFKVASWGVATRVEEQQNLGISGFGALPSWAQERAVPPVEALAEKVVSTRSGIESDREPQSLAAGDREQPAAEEQASLAERLKRMLDCGAIAKSLIGRFVNSLTADERAEAISILSADERGKQIAASI